METLRVIASRREEREYTTEPISDDAVEVILQAGRVAGSAKNVQPCRFTVIGMTSEVKEPLSELVTRPGNIMGATLLVAVTRTGPSPWVMFDAGRAVQNMLLAAWDLGIGSCPNTVKEPQRLIDLLGLPPGEDPVAVLSFGHPARRRDPMSRGFDEWVGAIDREPLEALTRRV